MAEGTDPLFVNWRTGQPMPLPRGSVFLNVLTYIPSEFHAAIADYTSTVSVNQYIQQAIDDAASNIFNAKTVYVPGGLYNLGDSLRLRSNVAIIGDGVFGPTFNFWQGVTVFKVNGSFPGMMPHVDEDALNTIELANFYLRGDFETYTGANHMGFLFPNSMRFGSHPMSGVFRNIQIQWFQHGAVFERFYTFNRFDNVTILGCKTHGLLYQSTDSSFVALFCGNSGIPIEGHVTPTPDATFQLRLEGDAGGWGGFNTFIGCGIFNANTYSCWINKSNNNRFYGCDFQLAKISGVIIGFDVFTSDNGFYGCTFQGNNKQGGVANINQTNGFDIEVRGFAVGTKIVNSSFGAAGFGFTPAAAIHLTTGHKATYIGGNSQNQDEYVAPGTATKFFLMTSTSAALRNTTIDKNIIQSVAGATSSTITSSMLQPQYTGSGSIINLDAEMALFDTSGGAVTANLPNPGFFGRRMEFVISVGGNTATFTASTANGFILPLATATTNITLGAVGQTATLISINSVQWQATEYP